MSVSGQRRDLQDDGQVTDHRSDQVVCPRRVSMSARSNVKSTGLVSNPVAVEERAGDLLAITAWFSKGRDQLDLLVREWTRFEPRQHDNTDECAFAQQ